MILYHYKNEKVIRMRRAIKRGLIVALGVIIQILLSLSVLIFFGQKIAVIETFYSILSILLVLRHNKRKQKPKQRLTLDNNYNVISNSWCTALYCNRRKFA